MNENYKNFVAELEKISKKYGVVLKAIGGVTIYEEPLIEVKYDCDETSGDLLPLTVCCKEAEQPGQGVEYISGSRRLSAQDIMFEDDITVENAIDGQECLNFYMATWFDVDEVFGTNVNTDENDDYLNVYANYSIEGRRVMDSLDICVNNSDGNVTELQYRLNDAEKSLILKAMESYCMTREGLTIDGLIEQLNMESDEAQAAMNTLNHN